MNEPPVNYTTTHLCMDVVGAIRARAYEQGGFQHPDGRPMNSRDAVDGLPELVRALIKPPGFDPDDAPIG